MSDATRVGIGRTVGALAMLGAVAGLTWMAALGKSDVLFDHWVIHNGTLALGFGALAFLVVRKQPRNAVVWVAAWSALAGGVYCLAIAVSHSILRSHEFDLDAVFDVTISEMPIGAALAVGLGSWLWVPALYLPMTLGFSLFPEGELPSRRWRWTSWVSISVLVLGSSVNAYTFRPSSDLTFGLAVDQGLDDLAEALSPMSAFIVLLGWFILASMIVISVIAMVVHYRRSEGQVRRQFKWVMWGAGVLLVMVMAAMGVELATRTTAWSRELLLVGLAVLITSYVVAIGKYRLYDVEVVISRTVVFAVLAAFIGLIYGTVVVGVGSLVGGGGWTPILATAVVALAFEPVRHLAQRWANRVAYGHRATPYEVLSDLTERLTGSGDGGEILERMAALLVEGTGADEATVWLGPPGEMRAVATTGVALPDRAVDPDAETVFSVTHDGEVVGALEVMKPRGSAFSSEEKTLVADLAGSAGAVFGYQRLNESLAEKAREIESSRRRLVEAEDEERRRLEHELNEGAEQLILALKVKIGLAGRTARSREAPALVSLIAALEEESQSALDEVRRLAKGIFPPILESDGLGPAVLALAASAPVPVEVSRDGIGRYPPEVEAAVYFDISEALTNAVKHGAPPIRIELAGGNGILRFHVEDTGPGFDPATARGGSGLENLHDRIEAVGGQLTITSAPGTGTKVSGSIPLPVGVPS